MLRCCFHKRNLCVWCVDNDHAGAPCYTVAAPAIHLQPDLQLALSFGKK